MNRFSRLLALLMSLCLMVFLRRKHRQRRQHG